MKQAIIGCVLSFVWLSCLAFGPSRYIAPEEPALEEWDVYKGMRSGQTIEEAAEMLWQYYLSLPRFTAPVEPPDLADEEVERALDLVIYEWTKQFCILNEWPLPECGPLVDRRLHFLIMHST